MTCARVQGLARAQAEGSARPAWLGVDSEARIRRHCRPVMPCLTCTAVCAQCTTGGRCARSAAAHACAQSSRARHAQSAGSSPGRTATCRTCSAPARAACPARAPLGLPAARGKLSCRVVKLNLPRTAAQTGQAPQHACQGDAWPAAAVRSSPQTHALLWCKVAAGGAAVDSMCKAAAVAAWQGAGARPGSRSTPGSRAGWCAQCGTRTSSCTAPGTPAQSAAARRSALSAPRQQSMRGAGAEHGLRPHVGMLPARQTGRGCERRGHSMRRLGGVGGGRRARSGRA